MKTKTPSFLQSYGFSLLLISSIIIGAFIGIVYKGNATKLKPLGDIFLNLIFTAIVPLVFFSISSTVAGIQNISRLGKIISAMLFVFVITGLMASAVMIVAVILYPPAMGVHINFGNTVHVESIKISDQFVKAFTVADFTELISKKNMLALILFSILTGLAAAVAGERGKPFAVLLNSGSAVMMKMITFIMYYAPVGLCAYFAYLIGVFGPQMLDSYARAMMVYYPTAILYFFIAFSLYAFIAAGYGGMRLFWKNIIAPTLIALATGSSMATIPANLEAADRNRIPKDIREIIIPIGATMHMEGSCLAAILKIAFLFGIFNIPFSGIATIITALGIALLTGVVVSGIPGGGTIGELLIISFYGFPMEAFPIITMIGTLVDAPATMLNAVGDNVAGMLVSRMLGGKDWMKTT